ncbi:YdcF family protein [Paenibacillus turpanensis]|uniref:YdcF family protein n=1 Tax=Paenibacillus turpanensis TaxID=2689078 RepID=UPI00140DB7C3|nr:YdcF family protein [Paenibacillus turpanensis]
MKAWRVLRRTVILLLAAGLLWTGYVQWRIASVEHSKLPERTDCAIVLGAALWNGAPSPALRERLDYAIQLYRERTFHTFIVSGGYDTPQSEWTEAQGMKRYLVQQGIPEQAVLEENQATSTLENVLFSKEVMKAHGLQTAVIVTHQYHGARTQEIAEFVGMEPVHVAVTASNVLWMPWHKARETLAFAKWRWDRLTYKTEE